jgi:hypothetical protein
MPDHHSEMQFSIGSSISVTIHELVDFTESNIPLKLHYPIAYSFCGVGLQKLYSITFFGTSLY